MNALQHDPNRPEDVLKVDADEDGVGDDAADCARYLVRQSRHAYGDEVQGLYLKRAGIFFAGWIVSNCITKT